jgi:hypothetical protein
MYKWYSESEVCYAFLEDVPDPSPNFSETNFIRARWFTRGWCLQELIAPRKIEFYSAGWYDIGTRNSLMGLIEDITGIPRLGLSGNSLKSYSIAEKMSWASGRSTTRVEDQAYCLLGIFGINMPLLYGEGHNAFIRLQEELVRQTEDLSLLLWSDPERYVESRPMSGNFSVLASSSAFFGKGGPYASSTQRCDYQDIKRPLAMHATANELNQWEAPQLTSRGLHVQLWAGASRSGNPDTLVLWTGYMHKQKYVCVMLQKSPRLGFLSFGRYDPSRISLVDGSDFLTFQLTKIYLNTRGTSYASAYIREVPSIIPDLEILVPYEQNTKIIILETSPPISFYGSDEKNQGFQSSLPLGSQLYCPDIRMIGAPTAFVPTSLLIKLKVKQSTMGQTRENYVIVVLRLRLGNPWCKLIASSSKEILDDQDKNDTENQISDRASLKCSGGSVVFASVKGIFQPQTLPSNQRRRRPACYSLHLSIRTGLQNAR